MSDAWIHSTKFDGSLHYRYPVQVVHRSEEHLVTYCPPGAPIESYRGSWTGTKHLLSHLWRGRPYVLHVRWDGGWEPEFLYIDVAMGANWLDGTGRYVDMDLDVILRPGSAAAELDDEDEFETHRAAWGYPEDVVGQCWAAVDQVRGLLATGERPFSREMFAWRPGEKLTV